MFIFRQLAEYLAHGFPLELKPVCVVHQSVQDGVGEGVVVDAGIPLIGVCATRDQRLFAAVPPQNENHSILSGSFRTAAPAQGAMPAQA